MESPAKELIKNQQGQTIGEIKKPQQNIDIQLQFGDDGGQQLMAQLKAKLFCYPSKECKQIEIRQRKIIQQIQLKQQNPNDALLILKFQVQTGRQRQSFEFIQKGLDQDIDNQNISSMQKLFHRPKTAGRIEMKQGKGFIYVIYRFYAQKIQSTFEEYQKIQKSGLDLSFQIEVLLKGKVQNSRRSFISVKPDYLKVKFLSQKLKMKDVIQFFQDKGQIYEQEKNTDYYRLLRNLQTVTVDLRFNSLRKVMKYYNRIINNQKQGQFDDNQSKTRQAPLSNKGIFKNYVSLNFYYSKKLAFEAEMNYKTQQVMLRLIARLNDIIRSL